ncbi:MAG: hypothetical protein LW595_00940 [Rickettsiales bacterium]|nr:hypothetical protein [Rickettsiales bacterium]
MIFNLNHRSIIEISGTDRYDFLQGLLTNDIIKSRNSIIYSAMLNPKGRFLFDFFIFESNQILILDCPKSRNEEIVKKFNFYKLRKNVNIKISQNWLILQNTDETDYKKLFSNHRHLSFKDPRSNKLGDRIYLINEEENKFLNYEDNINYYHYLRIINKITEGEFDLTYDKSIIAEFNFDDLNAIDYKKGCYVGQELTARTHYLGKIRKKLFYCQLKKAEEFYQNINKTATAKTVIAKTVIAKTVIDYKNQEIKILLNEQEVIVGIALSTIEYGNSQHLLALLDCENSEDKNFYEKIMNNPIYLNNRILKIIN